MPDLKFVGDPVEKCVRSVRDIPGVLMPVTSLGSEREGPAVTWSVSGSIQPSGAGLAVREVPEGQEPDPLTADEVVNGVEDTAVLGWMLVVSLKVLTACIQLTVGKEVYDPAAAREFVEWRIETIEAVTRRAVELGVEVGDA